MKKVSLFLLVTFSSFIAFSQEIKYTSVNNNWNPDSLGNHRAVIHFNGSGKVARSLIIWRRRDNDPWNKRIIVEDSITHRKISNVKTGIINNEKAEIWFEPISGRGDYFVYYMPSKNEGRSNYPKGIYLPPENTADSGWLSTVSDKIPVNTTVREIQSINELNSFFPMEVTATTRETARLISNSPRADMIVFPEDRMNPIKMSDRLPYRWIQKGVNATFAGSASRGEYYAYQLGVFALEHLEELTVQFSDLQDQKGNWIGAKKISCINTSGVDYTGRPFKKTIDVPASKIQALWCAIEVPRNIPAGIYKGTATILTKNTAPYPVSITLTVDGLLLNDEGISEPWKQTRLKWLNSTMAQDNTVIAPYTALQVSDNSISMLGRKLIINKDGFPYQIQTYFTEEMTSLKASSNDILTAPMELRVMAGGKKMEWQTNGFSFTRREPGTVQWKAVDQNELMQMDVNATLEFDGFCSYTVKVTALKDCDVNDILLEMPFNKSASKYMMGLGQKGGLLPGDLKWKWEVATKNQDGAWIGNVNAGLQYSMRDERYVRPLNTNFYLQKPLVLPSSWGNNNKGGVNIITGADRTVVSNYSGERKMKKGEVLFYNFTLLITPFHTINTEFQWETRFYHKYDNLDSIKASGATVVNIHHATPINPWLNYPFIEYRKMKAYIDSAHSLGLRVKIYNTVRELSNHAYETFPMRSLGHEIYSSGKGGGNSWLQEHLGDDYIAAWYVPEIKDAAILNSGMSRWHNYYVEGMNWLTQNVGIDGIYLDDVAFDRITMKRIKRVLTYNGHPGIIDLHSANQFNKNDGFNNSANLYMEHFPYLNRLWFGEYFDYENNGPDFFLTEVSGIPFGLMGEMLQDGGNPWRGMIYGMTNRFPWTEDADPRPIWKFWDQFGIKGTEMIGYWSGSCPVRTNSDKVLATVYRKKGEALVSIASWAGENTSVQLTIDWKGLGIDPSTATIEAKEIKNFQRASIFRPGDAIPVEKSKGWLLIIK